jgi:hypothetical protein
MNSALGRMPASVSWSAFLMSMNRIVVSPCGFLRPGETSALLTRRTTRHEIDIVSIFLGKYLTELSIASAEGLGHAVDFVVNTHTSMGDQLPGF